MRSMNTCFAILASFLLIITLSCALPVSAEETTTDGTAAAAPASQPPASVEPAAQDEPAEEEGKSKGRLVLLPAYNVYFPTSSKTQARFGDSWPAFGISVAWRDKNVDPKKIELRLDGIGVSNDKARAFIVPIGIGISQRLSSSKNMVTYAGLSANLYVGKVRSIPDNVDSGWKITGGPGAFVGANIGSRLNVQASYYVIPRIGGFGLSGLNLSAHFMLF